MARQPNLNQLSKRERQMMDAVYRLGAATALQVMEEIPNPPTNAAVRAKLQVLVKKGFLTFENRDGQYFYFPLIDRSEAERQEMQRLVDTFYGGSIGKAFVSLISKVEGDIDDESLREIERMIEKSRGDGR